MTDNSVLGADLALTVDEALHGITVHAARQIGMGHMIGTLEVGKDADCYPARYIEAHSSREYANQD